LSYIHVTDPRHGIPGARIKEKELEIEEQATKPAQELLNEVDLQLMRFQYIV
jgi:hypothetical protein